MMKNYLIKKEFFINNRKDQIKEHFDFIKEIGRGAYGVVYQAKQKAFPHHIRVVKRISKRKVKNPTTLINEIKVMSLLDHPHIVKVYETFEDQTSLFLVMDYCGGGELYSRLCSQKLFSQGKARTLFRQMVNAIRYMHNQKIAHRDIKLQNFMMVNDNSWDLMLIDFGLSFIWKYDMRSEVLAAQEGKIIGTPYYMSPEVLSHSYSEKCDIWSLGVMLYMLVTGTPPFDGENDKAIMQSIREYNYSLKTQECKVLSPALLDLMYKIFRPQKQRLSLEAIMQHPWVAKEKEFEDVLLNLQFKQLMQFSKFAKLKKVVATYIATQLSENEITSIRDIFMSIDDDQDGYITVEELHQFLLSKQGEEVGFQDLQKLVLSIDTDRNGKINYNQFIAMCVDEAIMSNEDYMRFAFNAFDLNRDGRIEKEQFKFVLKAYSKDFTCNEELVDALMNENDKNHDGVIDYSEFKNALMSVREMTRQMNTAMDVE